MKPQAPPRRSSAGIVVMLILLFGFAFVGMLAAAGVGFWVLSSNRAVRVQAFAEQDRAMREVERARSRVETELARARAKADEALARTRQAEVPGDRPKSEDPEINVAFREITVTIDSEGGIQADGKAMTLDEFTAMVQRAAQGRESGLSVAIKADDQCSFGHVAAVLSACQSQGIPNIRIATLDQ